MSDEDTTSQGRPGALNSPESDAATVRTIRTGGHLASIATAGGMMAQGAIGACGTGGTISVICYAAPLAAGIVGVMAGASFAGKLSPDEELPDLMGKPRQAAPGPHPAHLGHKIAHGYQLAGAIITGSPNVFFEGMPVARVGDLVACSQHPGVPQQIIEGSETIFVNDRPLARIGYKTSCTGVIQEGCKTILADNTTAQYGEIGEELSVLEQSIPSASEVLPSLSAVRFGSSKIDRKLLGEPIDPATGDYVDCRTDLEYPSILPLQLTRTYPGKDRVQGLLGSKWISNWSQRLLYDREEPTVVLEDADGQCLKFALGYRPEFNSRHLKAPYYHLTGTRARALLFDARTQQTLIFTTDEENSHVGRLTAIEDRNGNRIDFIYTAEHLSRIVHSDGIAFTVRTTREGYIESLAIEGEGGTLVQYGYDATGAMTDVRSLFGGEFHYTYTEEGWLKHWHDSGATRVDLDYDSEGRVIGTRTPEGLYNDRFIYFPEKRKTRYIDATGACRTLWFNEDNLLIREEDPLGNVTEHQWDGLERKKSTTDGLGRGPRAGERGTGDRGPSHLRQTGPAHPGNPERGRHRLPLRQCRPPDRPQEPERRDDSLLRPARPARELYQ
jgi:YD repeat-containing protein